MLVLLSFVEDMAVLCQQRLAGSRAAGFGLRLVVLEQGAAGRTAHAHCQVVVAQLQQLTEGAAGLQRQRAQAQRESTAHAERRVG